MLGQEQDSFGGGIAIEQSYSGAITQFNMWDRYDECLEKGRDQLFVYKGIIK